MCLSFYYIFQETTPGTIPELKYAVFKQGGDPTVDENKCFGLGSLCEVAALLSGWSTVASHSCMERPGLHYPASSCCRGSNASSTASVFTYAGSLRLNPDPLETHSPDSFTGTGKMLGKVDLISICRRKPPRFHLWSGFDRRGLMVP